MLDERTQLDPTLLEQVLDALVGKGLVERLQARTIPEKRSNIEHKAFEIRRHRQYYGLTRKGKRIAKEVKGLLEELLGNKSASNEKLDAYILLSIKPILMYILFHLKMAYSDYAKSIARLLKAPVEEVVLALDQLEEKS